MTGLSEGLHANCRMPREKWFGETWHDGQREEWGHSHYLNEPPLYELLVSGKKAMIDLREDHLSRCVRSRGRRSEVREGWRRMRSQKKKKEEEGKCKKKQILLERLVFMNPGPAPSQMGGEIHTFPARRWFASEVWAFLFFGAKAYNYHLRGARAPQRAHSPRKNGNFSSSVKVLSSSSSRLLLSQTPGAAHTETSVVDLLSWGWFLTLFLSMHALSC